MPTDNTKSELEQMLDSLRVRNGLKQVGDDTTELDNLVGPKSALDTDILLGGNRSRNMYDPSVLDRNMGRTQLHFQNMRNRLQEDGHMSMADSLTPDGTVDMSRRFPEHLDSALSTARTTWKNTRRDVALATLEGIQPDEPNVFMKFVAKAMGTDGVQIAMGGADLMMRSQQVLFGIMSGEGTSAFSRMFPSYVLPEMDKDGNPVVTSPMAEAIDLAWAKIRGDDEAIEKNRAELMAVNQASSADLIEMSDIADTWFGKDNMDQFYMNMVDKGILGQMVLGGVALTYAVGEVGLDPAIVFDFVPAKIITAARKATSTAVRASRTAELAYKTNKLLHIEEALDASKAHVSKAHLDHLRRKTEQSGTDLLNAVHHQAEVLDAYNGRKWAKGEDQVDILSLSGPGHRPEVTIRTTEVSPTANIVSAEKSPWALAMKKENLDVRWSNDVVLPLEYFRKWNSKEGFSVIAAGREEVEAIQRSAKQSSMMDAFNIFADDVGMRWFPFLSKGEFDGILGLHVPKSKTIFINMHNAYDEASKIGTMLHETQHYTFHSILSVPEQHSLLKGLQDAGFSAAKYGTALDPIYSTGKRGATLAKNVSNEYLSRATSEMATDPRFWEVLMDLSPETFEKLSMASSELAAKSARWIDNIGGKHSSAWLGGDGAVKAAAEWNELQRKILGNIEMAVRKTGKLKGGEVSRVIGVMQKEIKTMIRTARGVQKAGHLTPLLDESIEASKKYVKRLERDGFPALIDQYKMKAESLRALSPEEIREVVLRERRLAAARPTTEYQPRPDGWTSELNMADPETAARIAHGPDDIEHAAELLGRMTGGADIDDVVMRATNIPEHNAHTGGRIVPGTKQGMIDTDAIKRTIWKAKKMARSKGQSLAKYDPAIAQLDKALKMEKKAGSKKIKFEDGWLPKKQKKAIDRMETDWFKTHQATNYDRIANGLWPKTWRIRTPKMLEPVMATRAGQWVKQGGLMVRAGFMMMREPMRVLEAIDPGKSWVFLRAGLLNMENETVRLQGLFHHNMEQFGAITRREAGALHKIAQTDAKLAPKVHKEMDELLFHILDTSPSSDKYLELTKDLSAKQMTAVSNIRNELDLIGKKLGIPGDELIDGYIHHAFDPATFSKGGRTPEHMGMSRDGNLFFAAMLDRNGAQGYRTTAMGALEVYSRGVGRKLHLEPALRRITDRARIIAKTQPKNHFFQKYVGMLVANLSGTPSLAGALVDNVMGSIVRSSGRAYAPGYVSRKLMGLNSAIYTSLLAGNRRYPIMAIATGLATTTAQYGLFRTVKGLFKSATPEGQVLFKSMNADRGWAKIFEGNSVISQLSEQASRIHLGAPSIQGTENFIRGMTFWAAIDEHLTAMGYKTIEQAAEHGHLQEIMFDAMRSTEEVNHFFGVAGKPPVLGRMSKSGAAAATQFLSFPFKQAEQLLATTMENPGNIVRYMNMSGILSRVAAQELGLDLREYVGFKAIEARPSMLRSPMTDVMTKAAIHMNEMSKIAEGRGNAEAALRSGEDFATSLEVVVPLLSLTRSLAKGARADAQGEEWTPSRGKVRDIDLEYMGGVPVPSGKKGQRSEAFGMAMGAKTVQGSLHQAAQKKVRQVHVRAATERLMLVTKAQRAMDSGDWETVKKQMQRMKEMGFPIGDITNPIRMRMELDRLSWYLMEIKNNKRLLGQTTDIFKEYGILKTEDR